MGPLVIRVVVNAIALWVAVRFVPDVTFPAATAFPSDDWWKLVLVAVVFGLINAYIKPIAKAVSIPAQILTLGLFTFVINAVMLFLVALVAGALDLGFKLAGFPPDLSVDAFVAALLAALVISIVSTVLTYFLPDRASWRSRIGF
jgi:putative membrane protein